MIIHMEVSIDLDPNRKIWIAGDAEVDIEDMEQATPVLAESITTQALRAHGDAMQRYGLSVGSAEQILASAGAGERKPRPEDPESMRTFGED